MNTSTIGYCLIILAICLLLRGKVPYLGQLPGDFYFKFGNVQLFAPIASSLVLHFLITLVRGFFR